MTLRRFSSDQLALCEQWFGQIETPDEWIDRGPIGEGASQSIRVEHIGTGSDGTREAALVPARLTGAT